MDDEIKCVECDGELIRHPYQEDAWIHRYTDDAAVVRGERIQTYWHKANPGPLTWAEQRGD